MNGVALIAFDCRDGRILSTFVHGSVGEPDTAAVARLLRDDLDENGGGDLDFEAAAGSGVMIVADLQLCKFFRRRC